MFEILPNWHPFFVHFTVALLLTSVGFFLVSHFVKGETKSDAILNVGKWTLWVGAGLTVITLGTGFYAYFTVAHDTPSHLAMKDHRLWALITAGLFILLAGFSYRKDKKGKSLPGFFTPVLAIGAVLLGVTGYKGGELVYRHGLGVLSLPDVDPEAEGHSHDEGEGHEEASSETPSPQADLTNFDLETPSGTVNAFSAALKAGDADTVLDHLDENVLIYESGYVERSAVEYAGHHMPADMKFVGAMDIEILSQTETTSGDMATVVTESRTTGTYNDKDYNLMGTGTITLRREGEGWKITHIHWSSREAS